jgi:hypothetical protein
MEQASIARSQLLNDQATGRDICGDSIRYQSRVDTMGSSVENFNRVAANTCMDSIFLTATCRS